MTASSAGRTCRRVLFVTSLFMALLTAAGAFAQEVRVRTVAQGLETPWSLAFLPDGRMLVTERAGRLRLVDHEGRLSQPIAGVPRVHASGQGGLLDVVLSPDHARDAMIFLSLAEPTERGARTAVVRARLDVDGLRLEQVERIFAQRDDPGGGHHFGSRLAFAPDGSLFITLGDRNTQRERSQALDSHLGKIVRVMPDGSVPADNPFAGRSDALPEIWSYGHRNVQGATIHPETGVLWTHEHGPRGGDELNVGKPGANYGWPEVTYGRDYVTRRPFGEATEREGVEPPVHYWVPTSIALAGMVFHSGEAFPQWKGDLFIGALRGQMLLRLQMDGERVVAEHRLLEDLGARIRDVREGPDGALYLLDESNGRILRLEPAR